MLVNSRFAQKFAFCDLAMFIASGGGSVVRHHWISEVLNTSCG